MAAANVNVTVTAVNDAPSGADKTISLDEDGSYTFAASDFALTDLADEPAPNVLSAVKITTLPASGTLRLNGVNLTAGQLVSLADITAGKLVFTPAADFFGTATITYVATDGSLDSALTTVTVTVTAVALAPTRAVTVQCQCHCQCQW